MPFENYLGQKFLIVGFQILPEVRRSEVQSESRVKSGVTSGTFWIGTWSDQCCLRLAS